MAALPASVARGLKTVLIGVVIGGGAAAVAGESYRALMPLLESDGARQADDMLATHRPSPADLAIADVAEQRRDGLRQFAGTATNQGELPIDEIAVVVDFFAGEVFVDQCRKRVAVSLPAGESRPFVLDCGPVTATLPAYDRFELSPTGVERRS